MEKLRKEGRKGGREQWNQVSSIGRKRKTEIDTEENIKDGVGNKRIG